MNIKNGTHGHSYTYLVANEMRGRGVFFFFFFFFFWGGGWVGWGAWDIIVIHIHTLWPPGWGGGGGGDLALASWHAS